MTNQQSVYDGYEQQYELITSPIRIITILRPLIEKHALLTVSLPDNKEIFSSIILKADTDTNTMLLDGLHPEHGNALLSESKTINIRAQLNGIDVRFSIGLQSTNTADPSLSHVFLFPESIRYRQRRENYRAQVSPAFEIPVTLTGENDSECSGILFDISAGGVCVHFPKQKDVPEGISKDEISCKFTLPERNLIKTAFRVTHCGTHKTGYPVIGGRFVNLQKAQHRAIERFVLTIQRSQQKRSRSD